MTSCHSYILSVYTVQVSTCVRLYYNLQLEYNAISKCRHLDEACLFLLSYALHTKLHNSATTTDCHLPHGISHLLIITLFVIVLRTCYIIIFIKAFIVINWYECIFGLSPAKFIISLRCGYDLRLTDACTFFLFGGNALLLSQFLTCRLYVISCH